MEHCHQSAHCTFTPLSHLHTIHSIEFVYDTWFSIWNLRCIFFLCICVHVINPLIPLIFVLVPCPCSQFQKLFPNKEKKKERKTKYQLQHFAYIFSLCWELDTFSTLLLQYSIITHLCIISYFDPLSVVKIHTHTTKSYNVIRSKTLLNVLHLLCTIKLEFWYTVIFE